MRYSRICIHLSMTTSISHFLWRLGHFFKETQPLFSRFLDSSFFSLESSESKSKLSPHPVFDSSKDSPYRCLSLVFSGDKRSRLRRFPARAIGGPCSDARRCFMPIADANDASSPKCQLSGRFRPG